MALALHRAVRCGRSQQVRYLIECVDIFVDVNARDSDGKTALMLCCELESERVAVNITRLLLENGADVMLGKGDGVNALLYACQLGRRGIVAIFLAQGNCKVTHKDNRGYTALHYVAANGDFSILLMLIKYHKKYRISVDTLTNEGETALILAAKHGHGECATLLIAYGNASQTVRDNLEFKTASEWAHRTDGVPFADKPPRTHAESVENRGKRGRTLSASVVERSDPGVFGNAPGKRPHSTGFTTNHEKQRLCLSQSDTTVSVVNTEFEHPRNAVHDEVTRLYGIYCAQHSTSYRLPAKVVQIPTPSPEPTEEDSWTTEDAFPPPGRLVRKKSAKGGKRLQNEAQKRLNHLTTTAQTVAAIKRKARLESMRPRTPRRPTRPTSPEAANSDGENSRSSSPSNSQTSNKLLRGLMAKKLRQRKSLFQTDKVDENRDGGETRQSASETSTPTSRPNSVNSDTSSLGGKKSGYLRRKEFFTALSTNLQVIQSESETCTPEPTPTRPPQLNSFPSIDSGFASRGSPPHPRPAERAPANQDANDAMETTENKQEGDGHPRPSAVRPKSARKKLLLRRRSSKMIGQNISSRTRNGEMHTKNGKDDASKGEETASRDSPSLRRGTPKGTGSPTMERETTSLDTVSANFRHRNPESAQASPRTLADGNVFKFPKGQGSGDSLRRPHSQNRTSATLLELDARILELKNELKLMKKRSRLSAKGKVDSPCPSSSDEWQNDNHRQGGEKETIAGKQNHVYLIVTKADDPNERKHSQPKKRDSPPRSGDGRNLLRPFERRGTKSELVVEPRFAELRKMKGLVAANNDQDTKVVSGKKRAKPKRNRQLTVSGENCNESTDNSSRTSEDKNEEEQQREVVDDESDHENRETQRKLATKVLAKRLRNPAHAPSRFMYSLSKNAKKSKCGRAAVVKINPAIRIYLKNESHPLTRANRMPSVGQNSKSVKSSKDALYGDLPKAVKSLFRGK